MSCWRLLAVLALSSAAVALYLYCQLPSGANQQPSSFQPAPAFPEIKSKHSLVAKHVTEEKWQKLGGLKTKTSGFTLGQVT